MNTFNQEHLNHIKAIFEEKTGAVLPSRATARRPVRTALILAAILVCLTMTAFAVSLFSTMSGDALSLDAVYQGNGIVTIAVENKSARPLTLEPTLKLTQGKEGTELPAAGPVRFDSTTVPARSSSTITVDLSAAYDMAALESPDNHDFHTLVLTNDRFLLGQRWTCTVKFSYIVPDDAPLPAITPDEETVAEILLPLQPYFASDTREPFNRWTQGQEYLELAQHLLSQVEGNIVPSAAPHIIIDCEDTGVIFDESVPADRQHQLVGLHYHVMDGYYKCVGATESEKALVLSAYLPQSEGGTIDSPGGALPLLYFFTYEKSAIESQADYAFIRGRLLTFGELEQHKVWEDKQYVCYEVSHLFYSDLRTHAERLVEEEFIDARLDEDGWQRVQNIYNYFKDPENLAALITCHGGTVSTMVG